MKDYVVVTQSLLSDEVALRALLAAALDHTRSRPPKVKKERRQPT